MPRKARSDSVTSAINHHATVREGRDVVFDWPAEVSTDKLSESERAEAEAVFDDLQRGRSSEHWSPHHKRMLADLALLYCQRSRLVSIIAQSGGLVKSPKNDRHVTTNPAITALSALQSSIAQLEKAAGLTAAQMNNDKHSQAINGIRQRPLHPLIAGVSMPSRDDDLLA